MSDLVEYRVGLASRARHLYQIEARFPSGGRRTMELRLPVWTPGSYLVREYQRHVQDLRCTDPEGRTLAVRKVAKSRWLVECDGASQVRATYHVYAHEVSVRTSHLDDTHAFWNGATLFLYVDELRAAPCRVQVDDLPAGWRIDTALTADPDAPHLLHAADHDTLIDSPVEAGPHDRIEFLAAGRPHVIALWGRSGALDTPTRDRLVTDLRAIIEAQAALFGGVPYDRYTFLMHLVPGGYGGLEHQRCCTVLTSPHAFAGPPSYKDLLELLSHEFFHLWNGKRIRPAALGPFDYQQECYTRSLWVVEGWTSYYDQHFLLRSGRIDADTYLAKIAEDIGKLLRIPGRCHQSLEESSWDAWIKLYRPDENTVNSTVSYYLKGGVVALLLDLEIRRRSGGTRSLDDALRALWRDFQQTGAGYPDEALQGIVETATGCPLADFFEHAVRGRGELDIDGGLRFVGLRLKRTADTDDTDDDAREGGWLGATLKTEAGRLKVTEALEGGPAQLSNLYAGDEIVALEGWRVDERSLGERLRAARPGDGVRMTLFRRDELREVTVTLGQRPRDKLEIEPVSDAPQEARLAYAAWLGEPWKAPE